ncbi:MAG: EamA family transporter [Nanoarchaeota archaeon]
MFRVRWWAIVLIVLTTVFTTAAQLLYKTGSARLPELLTNWPLLAGMACYAVGAFLMIISFKGGDVSILYPLLATSYIWVTIASSYIYGEPVTAMKIIGLFLIIVGISVIGAGSKSPLPEVP